MLGDVGVGAYEGEDEVGVVGAGGPHLLAVDHEVVAVELGPGAEAGEVGAGVGLGHAERGGDVAPQQRDGPLLLLLLGAESSPAFSTTEFCVLRDVCDVVGQVGVVGSVGVGVDERVTCGGGVREVAERPDRDHVLTVLRA